MKNIFLAVLLALSVSFFAACDSGGDDDSTSPDVNIQPIFLSSAPTVAQIGIQYTYNVSVIDVDTPSSMLTIVTNIYDTCLGNFDYNGDGEGVYTFTPDAAQVGTDCEVGFTASDGKLMTDQVSTVHIGDTNAAPYFTSTAPTTATEDALYNYDITVADDNVPAQILTITEGTFNTCGGSVVDNGDGTGSYSFTPDENDGGGSCLLSLTVTDSMGESVDQNAVITISEDNKTPSFTSTAPATATERALYTYAATVADPDSPAQTLTCSINGSDTCGGALTACTYTFTPGETQGGTNCVVGLNVSDGALSAGQNSTVNVAEDNQAPSFASSAPTTAMEGALYTYSATVTDPDIPSQTLACSTNAFNTCGGVLAGCVYSFTPTEFQGGANCMAGITVTDSLGASADQNTAITVTEDNKAPSFISSAPATSTEGVLYTYVANVVDPDSPAQTLTCSINGSDTCAGSLTGCTYTFTPNETQGGGSCIVGLTVTDDGAGTLSADQNTTVNVAEDNQAPYFTSTSPTSASEGVAYSYNPAYLDDDAPNAASGDPGYVTCALSNNTCGAWLSATGCNASGTPTESDAPGNCGYRLTIQDGIGATAIQDVTLALNEVNIAPYFTSTAATTASEAVQYSYSITIGDNDLPANAITISTSGSDTCNGTLVDNGNRTGTYTFTPNELQGGTTCVVGLIATDNGSPVLSATQNTTVTISEVNQAPSFTSTAPTTATEGVLYTYSATVTDPDLSAQTLTCSKNGDTCGGSLTGCAYTFTPSESQGGANCAVGLRVTDGLLNTDQNTTVTVSEANQAPVWSSVPASLSVVTGQAYNATNGTATDADLPGQTLTCSSVSSTCSFAVNVSGSGTSPRNCAMSFTAGANPETCGVNVQVSDGAGGTITQSVMISVQQCRKFVDDDATGTGDGSSWTNAYTVIQDAVDASWSGCEIWVAEGDYFKKTAGTGNVLTMKSGVDIYGGFIGVEISLADRLYPAEYPTILDGEDTSYHVVVGASNARFDGFYVTGGNAIGASSPDERGSGIYNSGVNNLIIVNNIFGGNSANYGGGIFNASSSPTISNCEFSGNSTVYDGGGIYNASSSPSIANCAFSGNLANRSGGGIYNASSSPTITNCAFSGNLGSSSNAGYGGGIRNNNSSSTITNCAFLTNYANTGGGIANFNNSSATITNCLFTGNSAYWGGGIDNETSSPTITNCSFSGNSANRGGGIENYNDTSPAIINCVIWGNTASGSGPSIYNFNATTSTPTVSYSDAMGCGGSGAWVAGCGIDGGGNIDLDPLFITGLFGAYYLSQTASGQASDSPCLNTGSATAASLGLDTRTTRTDNAPDSGTVDMGYHYPIP